MLGVARLVLLGHRDSGLPGWPDAAHRRALAAADPLVLARRVAEIADAEGADTVVHDDEQGIYGHPDHRATCRIGPTAAELVGATGYAVTIDREHLHVVARDGHLVHGAARAAAVDYGRVTAEIALAVTGTPADLDAQAGRDPRPREPGRARRRPAGRPSRRPTATSGTAAPAPRACWTASATPTSSLSDAAGRTPRASGSGVRYVQCADAASHAGRPRRHGAAWRPVRRPHVRSPRGRAHRRPRGARAVGRRAWRWRPPRAAPRRLPRPRHGRRRRRGAAVPRVRPAHPVVAGAARVRAARRGRARPPGPRRVRLRRAVRAGVPAAAAALDRHLRRARCRGWRSRRAEALFVGAAGAGMAAGVAAAAAPRCGRRAVWVGAEALRARVPFGGLPVGAGRVRPARRAAAAASRRSAARRCCRSSPCWPGSRWARPGAPGSAGQVRGAPSCPPLLAAGRAGGRPAGRARPAAGGGARPHRDDRRRAGQRPAPRPGLQRPAPRGARQPRPGHRAARRRRRRRPPAAPGPGALAGELLRHRPAAQRRRRRRRSTGPPAPSACRSWSARCCTNPDGHTTSNSALVWAARRRRRRPHRQAPGAAVRRVPAVAGVLPAALLLRRPGRQLRARHRRRASSTSPGVQAGRRDLLGDRLRRPGRRQRRRRRPGARGAEQQRDLRAAPT